ncbi:YbaK/EbsC family protein, partial [Enterococcus italicus]|uniref:YbaK/EbsC family protein n=1 Tax=Enterococcus italicus TaxID=246144 RepID=UPI003FA27B65
DDEVILIVVAGDQKIDTRKFKAYFQKRARMVAFDQVEEAVGHAAGGVCPFAVNEGVKIYLDISLQKFVTVFPACGSSNSAIELTIDELARYANSLAWVDVCKEVE